MGEININVIIKLKNKNNELKYKNADFYIIKDFDRNTEEVVVSVFDENASGLKTSVLIANRENVEYIYLCEEKSEDAY